MPFVSKAQDRFMFSKSSPLSEAQKKEWAAATDFSSLPERVRPSGPQGAVGKPKPEGVVRYSKYGKVK